MTQPTSAGPSIEPAAPRTPPVVAAWCALALVVPTALVMLFAGNQSLTPEGHLRQNVTLVLAIVALAGAALTLLASKQVRQSAATLPLLVIGGAVLVIAAILWNKAFLRYYTTDRPIADIFRSQFANLHSPLYGISVARPVDWILVAFAVGLAFVLVMARWRWRILDRRALVIGLIAVQLLLTLLIGAADHRDRIVADSVAYARYWLDGEKFSSVSNLMRDHIRRMPELSGSGQHYPPGIAMMFVIQKQLHISGLVKFLGVLLPALALLPIGALAMELGLGRRAAALAQVLFCTSGSVLWFPTISPTPAMMFFAATTLWLLVRALRRDQITSGLTLGLVMGVFAVFTFACYMVAAIMGLFVLFTVATRRIPLLRAVKVVGAALLAFVIVLVLLNLVSGFNVYTCFRAASSHHLLQTGHGFDTGPRYLLRGIGSMLAYLIAAGVSLGVLGISAMVRRSKNQDRDSLARPFFLATAGAILFATFNSMAFLESERIWLLFSPALAVVAGYELWRRAEAEGRMSLVAPVALSLLMACSTVLVFKPHWAKLGPRQKSSRIEALPIDQAPRQLRLTPPASDNS